MIKLIFGISCLWARVFFRKRSLNHKYIFIVMLLIMLILIYIWNVVWIISFWNRPVNWRICWNFIISRCCIQQTNISVVILYFWKFVEIVPIIFWLTKKDNPVLIFNYEMIYFMVWVGQSFYWSLPNIYRIVIIFN